jgi:hypothetical protein
LKITGDVGVGLEGFVSAITLENDDRHRHRRTELDRGKEQSEHGAKLFEPVGDLPDVFIGGIANQGKVLRIDPGPIVFRLDTGRP